MIWDKWAWIAVTLLLLGFAVIASLAFWLQQGTPLSLSQRPGQLHKPTRL
jgi:hypothetical protein